MQKVTDCGLADVVSSPLDNAKCTKIDSCGKKEVVFREPELKREIKGIMLLYSVVQSSNATINGYYNTGTSTHYCIERDGRILGLVDPKNIAFFAGGLNLKSKNRLMVVL